MCYGEPSSYEEIDPITACGVSYENPEVSLNLNMVGCKECLHELHLRLANAFQEVHERLREEVKT